MIYQFVIPGEPLAKARPRATLRAGHAAVYTPAKTANYEGKVALAFKQAYPDAEPIATAIGIFIKFHFPLNKADYNSKGEPNKKGKMKLNGEIRHTKKGDIDNLIKSVLDGLNGIAFVDDALVDMITAAKDYSLSPSVEVIIEV